MNNIEKDIRQFNKDKQWPTTPSNFMPQNGLLNELSSTFKKVTFSESKFLVRTLVSNTWYKYFGTQNKNLFYLLNDQLDYALTHYFAELETTKYNIDKFLSNLLIKLITKKLSYCNLDEWIEKLFMIPWGILDHR